MAESLTFDAFLFDMDGTILTSIPAVERAWTAWADRIGAPAEDVLHYLHGRPARDTIARFAPQGADIPAEVAWLDAREMEDLDGIAAIAGATALGASMLDGGRSCANADSSCVSSCRAAHSDCRLRTKGSASCDGQLQACLQSCLKR